MPVASIIIPTKDRPMLIRRNLDFLQKAIAGKEIEVIVVNDGKPDPDLSAYTFATIYQNPKSGVASARNLGVEHAAADRLIFLDDDMLIFPENIDSLLSLTRDIPDQCINLNWIYPPDIQQQLSGYAFGRYLVNNGFTTLKGWNRGNYWNDQELFETKGITSQFLYISKKAFQQAGGYTESFPHAGFEDYDLSQKLHRQQTKFYIYPLSTCWHNEIDRLTPESWLERKKREAQTRKHAVNCGYKDLALHYNFPKKVFYTVCSIIKPLIFYLMSRIPNQKSFDFLYFSCIKLLFGTVVYEGYRKS